MTLARLFEMHAAPLSAAAFAAHRALHSELVRLHQEGQAAWPQLAVTPDQLTMFLARQLPPEAAEPQALASLRAGELYLLCAFHLRHAEAQAILQTHYLAEVRRTLLQRGVEEALIFDIQQELCRRLIEQQDPSIARRGYSGRGDLLSWLRTVALREASLRRKRGQRETVLTVADDRGPRDPHKSPEAVALAGDLRQTFKSAFREALAALSSRERNLLRYHYLLRHSIDQIGEIYRVHRATAARWLARSEEHLIRETRERFIVRAGVAEQSLPGVMEELRSQLSINLGNLLHDAVEHDASKA